MRPGFFVPKKDLSKDLFAACPPPLRSGATTLEIVMRQLVALLALAFALPVMAAGTAPHVRAQSFDQLAKPLPLPYDEKADAMVAVDKARAKARGGHKLLLIDLGGNWCLDCRILAGTMDLPEMRAFMSRHFELVTVDIGRFDKNLVVPARYGITQRLEGVPSVLVVDPRSDKLINAGRIAALADARSMSPQALADWLAQWAR